MTGSCSIVSSKKLIPENGKHLHDRQIALLVFEQLGLAHNLYKLVDKEVTDAISKFLYSSDQIVEKFSRAERTRKAMNDELKKEKMGVAIEAAFGLVVSSGLGFLGASATASVNLVVISLVFSTV